MVDIRNGSPTSGDRPSNHPSPLEIMSYACQSCVRRKVKCDKTIPACSSCIRGKVECIYQAPSARRPKRKRSETVYERLARYERALQESGLLSKADTTPVSCSDTPKSTPATDSLHIDQPETTKSGKLLSGECKARYIDGHLWRDLGEIDMLEMSENEEDSLPAPVDSSSPNHDLLLSSLHGKPHNLTEYHPSPKDVVKLWTMYTENVEPLCKVLHTPSTARLVERVSQQPGTASKMHECLLFAIYHFAVYSITDEDCMREFGQSQGVLLGRYQHAVRQALVNASWLKTTAMPVMQAYVLFLMAMRTQIDPHTFWILTGVAVRIAQRMGLHHDGESLGLPPFDVEMRRRVFWQLLPLEGYAGQISGTGISITPDSWDTRQPLNVNDDQIYPGMTQMPEEQTGATEMIYCLARTELSKFYTRTGVKTKEVGASLQLRDNEQLEKLIDEVENTIEAKYLRYCDIVDPLHFLTLGRIRSAANVVRLHSRMPQLMKKSVGDHERRALCVLAQKILEADSAVYSHPRMKKFHWSFKSFFLGDALLCILTSLVRPGFFAPAELDTAWSKLADVFSNHPEILEAKRAIHIAVGNVTLKAWTANPPTDSMPEPGFITALRCSQRTAKQAKPPDANDPGSNMLKDDVLEGVPQTAPLLLSPPDSVADALFGSLDDGMDNLGNDFNLDVADRLFWDQFIRDYENSTDMPKTWNV
ncbi:hypothetical protein A1O1_00323 [Capronia coronata CBS 617.96]|uniref:Zn(2)-C6 fungal-type domain-containing protein n=1 Tax=Capronia coronata CBS 617.96 TaxID=1182541 RepID=W9ZL02_9EURO|nr:uncharacterized protein A1O1_00323 [Capronia coronata CBS 617.96]EXJ95204.1 hypothetical protein A1O1_00323 [Capronia coronata CBS 617.96]